MIKIEDRCPNCSGFGTVAHVPRVPLEGEIPNPNALDRYKTTDVCGACRGSGKRMIEVVVEEEKK